MLLSMTGFGEARIQTETFAVAIEVRTVNNRHLKVSVRGTDPYPLLEAEFEKLLRKTLKRGSVHVQVRVSRQEPTTAYTLNTAVLTGYINQLRAVVPDATDPIRLGALLAGLVNLPGVAPESSPRTTAPDDEWPVVEQVLAEAMAKLDAVRQTEGRAMAADLTALLARIREALVGVRIRLPAVQSAYRERLLDRIRQAVSSAGVAVEPDHLIRELALYADRTDVSEELTRLEAHLQQFADVVQNENDSPGRRLEFVIQEMGRETNTLGSKAGDLAISKHVVEMKATLEKIRELVLNVE